MAENGERNYSSISHLKLAILVYLTIHGFFKITLAYMQSFRRKLMHIANRIILNQYTGNFS
jgi:hypothetical protein